MSLKAVLALVALLGLFEAAAASPATRRLDAVYAAVSAVEGAECRRQRPARRVAARARSARPGITVAPTDVTGDGQPDLVTRARPARAVSPARRTPSGPSGVTVGP